MVRRAVILAAAGAAFLIGSPFSPVLRAQRGAPPPAAGQANPNNPPKATALILGQVVDGTSGQPISDAVVTLSGNGMRGAGGKRVDVKKLRDQLETDGVICCVDGSWRRKAE